MSIEGRNIVPSRNSLKEGQIVVAKDPKKGLSMFVKSGADIYSIPLSATNKENVFDSMTINGNARINNKLISDTIDVRNLSYTKFTDYRTFQHNFRGDIGTDEVYIPWGSHDENVNPRGSVSYLAPFKMTFYKLLLRPEDGINASADYTFKIKIAKIGSGSLYEVGTYQLRNEAISSTTDENYFTIYDYNFLINAPFDDLSLDVGQKVYISIQANNDPTSSDLTWNMTSVWKVEVDLS